MLNRMLSIVRVYFMIPAMQYRAGVGDFSKKRPYLGHIFCIIYLWPTHTHTWMV